MNTFEKIITFLQKEIETPKAWGWFHLNWFFLTILLITLFVIFRKKYSQKQMKTVLLIYAILSLILEITKQVIWSFNFDPETLIGTWDFQWYAFPFQLCTTPIYVCILISLLKKGKFQEDLIYYLIFITIIGSLATMFMPDSCFCRTLEVDIHTMVLHFGSFVVSFYLIMHNLNKINFKNFLRGYKVFLIMALIANMGNIILYKSGILHGETFNMFYISPYFPSVLPVFCDLYYKVPYVIYLVLYLLGVFIGGLIIYLILKGIKKIKSRRKK